MQPSPQQLVVLEQHHPSCPLGTPRTKNTFWKLWIKHHLSGRETQMGLCLYSRSKNETRRQMKINRSGLREIHAQGMRWGLDFEKSASCFLTWASGQWVFQQTFTLCTCLSLFFHLQAQPGGDWPFWWQMKTLQLCQRGVNKEGTWCRESILHHLRHQAAFNSPRWCSQAKQTHPFNVTLSRCCCDSCY